MSEDILYYEPRKEVLSKIEYPKKEPEMTEFESAFLCGLLRKKMPKNIVEVGVAGGGTTAIILQCIKDLGIDKSCMIHSIDISEIFYRDKSKKTGYLGEEIKNQLGISNHKFMFGVLPDFVEEISRDQEIDFVVLDTTHKIPGEVLDFLAVLPYLADGAHVVLHDVALNHISHDERACSTKVLFDTVVAEKIFINDEDRPFDFANIAAFAVNNDTKKYIMNCFSSLTLSWSYIPDMEELSAYLTIYSRHFPKECIDLFNKAINLNVQSCRLNTMPFYKRIRTAARILIKGF